MDIDDLRNIAEHVERVAGPTELILASGPRPADQLENLSTHELAKANIASNSVNSAQPGKRIGVGLRRRGGAGVFVDGDAELEQSIYDFILAHSKPWYNVRHVLAFATPLLVVVTAALVVWYAIDVRLDARLWVPAALGLAVFGVAASMASRALDKKLAQSRSGVKINPESRNTLRERRWNQRRDIWATLGGASIGALLTWLGLK